MTEREELFYTRYQKPTLDEFVQGFSGIDPPKRVKASEINHEHLNNLLGGDETGHYHLTRAQIEKLFSKKYPPEIADNQVIYCTASEEITPYEIQGQNLRQGTEN